jgi:hypothetical protein
MASTTGEPDLRITFIDVEQADAILIQTPRGHATMIDTGGRLEQSESGDGASAAESIGENMRTPTSLELNVRPPMAGASSITDNSKRFTSYPIITQANRYCSSYPTPRTPSYNNLTS